MTHIAFNNGFIRKNRKSIYILVVWVAGLIIGCGIFYTCRTDFLSLMGSAVFQPVSIVGMLSSMFFPFFFIYLSIITNNSIYTLIVIFIKAVSFASTGALIAELYVSAGWLLRFLFLFSDYCFLPVLIWLWMRCSDSEGALRIKLRLLVIILFALAVASINYWFVSPLLQSLI